MALIGLRGAGKSTLGSRLGQEINLPFIELDREIEKDTGMPLGEIFSLYGQTWISRDRKASCWSASCSEHERAIISVGGGVVSEKETYDYLLANCYTIWIKARPEEYMARVIAQGDLRVMGGSNQAMEDLRTDSRSARAALPESGYVSRHLREFGGREFCGIESRIAEE